MTSNENRRGGDIREVIVDAIVASTVKSRVLKSRKQIKRYLKQYFANVPVEDLQGRSEKVMARVALDHLEFAAKRRKGEALIRLFNTTEKEHGYTSAFTFVEMVNDDMPFLVDSVAAAINRHSMIVHITVHPIIFVKRDKDGQIEAVTSADDDSATAESFVRFAVDRETDAGELKRLRQEISKVLGDVRLAVRDWKKMRQRMLETADLLDKGPKGADPLLRSESKALLEWMEDEHFTFLGYREYVLSKRGKRIFLNAVKGSGLGILSRDDRGTKGIELTDEMRRLTRSRDWLILTKANSRSTIHRPAFLDYVGVKVYDDDGNTIGERRFIGLLTSVAYSESPQNIPLLRHKVQKIFERAQVNASGHRGKALLHIINTYPREELFQSSVQDLTRTTIGILNLQDRQRIKFFLRRDPFRRFFSCLVYVPREKYTTAIRRRIEALLLEAFGGISVDSSVQISDSALARVHLIVRTPEGKRPRISIHHIEEQIADLVITWSDRLRDELLIRFGPDEGARLYRAYRDVFPAGFQEDTIPREACSDVQQIDEMLRDEVSRAVSLYVPPDSLPGHMHFMIYSRNEPIVLSEALPVLEYMGVDVYTERPYEVDLKSGECFWIQDFHLRHESGAAVDIEAVSQRFEDCFLAVLHGDAENDGLNRLVVGAGLNWRQTALLRCYAKHILQLRVPFSQAYMEDVLVIHAGLAALLVRQFEVQFDPDLSKRKRDRELKEIGAQVKRGVAKARNVDEDRILTAFAGGIDATLRSNYFQTIDGTDTPKPYISIKLDPARLPEIPLPRPQFEVFVYSPEVEGVHLRNGDIARGGLRWSDRREDFRTEVLGLMKAQVVKNTVIVPTGAKGGFFPKRAPVDDRAAIQANGIHCYKTFIRGLLDLTDNVVDDEVITPERIVRRDGDDPYLVVAADKGTATFSDIANSLSAEYSFWLDDAFASGGSAGYDHKGMGITARGAWEAVKRHFHELGVNIQKQPFSVAGIGDMSGDVFGNGMLLSKKIRLVAAFNHRRIFLDPDPDTAASFRERKRLFRKPGSTWDDYDESLISKGGGVFSRQAKTIRLSNEVRKLLDVSEQSVQPDELIRAILRMPVDLLWNGGIGTYAKASSEGHSDVGDRSNDAVRVDADELRCKVIGEGGNLGFTQRARVEFSQHGGRINTDFIDNSGGVDCSDREVNIKILLSDAAKKKGLSRKKRDELLASMTDDVATLVLRNNYLQTQAISMSERLSVARIDETARLIASLERTGLLNRDLEYLPHEAEIDDRRSRKQGFTRPELAIVLSYAKIDLYKGLIDSEETLEDFLQIDPQRYFPPVLRRRYVDLIPGHRLSRQILATLIANALVNRMGPAFVKRVQVDTGAKIVTIARAYEVARIICRATPLLRTIESLDHKIPASAQLEMMFEVSRILRHTCYWLIEHFDDQLQIVKSVERLKDGMASIYTRSGTYISKASRVRNEDALQTWIAMGVPEKLAGRMSLLLVTRAALDIADIAAERKRDVLDTARLYSTLNDGLGMHWLHNYAEDLKVSGRWQAMARSNLRDEFYRIRRDIALRLLTSRSRQDPEEVANKWLNAHEEKVARFTNMVEEMKLRGDIDFATLSVAAKELRSLISN
ncbi:MAG: NAD-glutamate dehydrogenase [Gammaproteobacteria bacterium]|nr:NAD-glutamate dehydrogenase [Gammaproteobacteria bacterium]MBT8110613.1 NAD-glutamate dehydrogenase [Gammaproteobacteria bacterium]NND46742.1 NAD-glutamate dehydrogenase [Woeseiaceae bacterium]NNL45313.1 NAD-glutamate dehydrogenase [Woeseiaceae bacterium]